MPAVWSPDVSNINLDLYHPEFCQYCKDGAYNYEEALMEMYGN